MLGGVLCAAAPNRSESRALHPHTSTGGPPRIFAGLGYFISLVCLL